MTFIQWLNESKLNESEFYVGRTKYACYWGKYSKTRNNEVEYITAAEYFAAKKKYNKSNRRNKFSSKKKSKIKEQAQFYHAVDSNPGLYKERNGKKCYAFTQNYFHIFLYDKDGGKHKILNQMPIIGNEKLIKQYMRRYGNEG